MAAKEFEKNFTALDAIRRPRHKRPPRERVRSLAHGETFLQRKTRSLSWRHRASLPLKLKLPTGYRALDSDGVQPKRSRKFREKCDIFRKPQLYAISETLACSVSRRRRSVRHASKRIAKMWANSVSGSPAKRLLSCRTLIPACFAIISGDNFGSRRFAAMNW